jgi:hypothetical protein
VLVSAWLRSALLSLAQLNFAELGCGNSRPRDCAALR